MLTPEQAIVALQIWFQQQLRPNFKSVERRLRSPGQVLEQPALFLVHENSETHWSDNSLEIDSITLKAWIFAQNTPPVTTPATYQRDIPGSQLNALVQGIANALSMDNDDTGQFTLGGKVSWCRIDGTTELYPGDLGEQAMAIVPIRILLTI